MIDPRRSRGCFNPGACIARGGCFLDRGAADAQTRRTQPWETAEDDIERMPPRDACRDGHDDAARERNVPCFLAHGLVEDSMALYNTCDSARAFGGVFLSMVLDLSLSIHHGHSCCCIYSFIPDKDRMIFFVGDRLSLYCQRPI